MPKLKTWNVRRISAELHSYDFTVEAETLEDAEEKAEEFDQSLDSDFEETLYTNNYVTEA